MVLLRHVLLLVAALVVAPAFAQATTAPVDNMQSLRAQLAQGKKQVVMAALQLTEVEAQGFWPAYEDYQKALQTINERLATTIVSYAREYNAKTLTDQKAAMLLEQSLSIEEEQTRLKRGFMPRLSRVLPGIKLARYLQLENKIHAVVMYEIAAEVPLAQ